MSTLEQKVWEKNKKQLLQQNKHLHAELHRLQHEIEQLEAELLNLLDVTVPTGE